MVETWADQLVDEGVRKREMRKALEIARNFKAKSISVDEIVESTGLYS